MVADAEVVLLALVVEVGVGVLVEEEEDVVEWCFSASFLAFSAAFLAFFSSFLRSFSAFLASFLDFNSASVQDVGFGCWVLVVVTVWTELVVV